MEQEERKKLIVSAQQGDDAALERLTMENIALVKSVVKRFLGRGVEFDDLMQIGTIGLIKAIKNFNCSYDVMFSTYAVPLIMGEIKRFFRDDGPVKVSRTLKELAAQVLAAKSRITAETGMEPALSQLAEAVGAPVEDIVRALDAAAPCISLDEPVFGVDSDVNLLDRIGGSKCEEDGIIDRVLIKEMLSLLEPWERVVIFARYFEDKTQSEIASKMGISQVQVSRIEQRILNKLRARVSQPPQP